jgi:hypothetical protein
MCSISGKTGNSSLSLSLSRPAAHTTRSQLGTRHSLCSAYRRAYGVGSIDYLVVLRQLLPFCTQRTHVGAVDHRYWCCEQTAPRSSIGRDLRGRCARPAYHRVTDMFCGPASAHIWQRTHQRARFGRLATALQPRATALQSLSFLKKRSSWWACKK